MRKWYNEVMKEKSPASLRALAGMMLAAHVSMSAVAAEALSVADLRDRVARSAVRLTGEKYRPDKVFLSDAESGGWPGDTEGRTLLALVLQHQALGEEPKYLAEILRRVPSHLNAAGYMGEVRTDVLDEQQLSGNGWMLRALCTYAASEPHPVIDAKGIVRKMARGLFLPGKGRFATYPIDPAARAATGGASGHIATTKDGWRLSSDTGCVFIGLDGLVHAWRLTGDAELKPVIEELCARFLEMDLVKTKAQTHASLTALRALLRYDPVRYLSEVERRFELYVAHGMTDRYENYNWFGREDTWTEPCAIVDSLLLAHELAVRTGKARYADFEEKFLGALAAHQRDNGGFGLQKTFPKGSQHPPEEHVHEAHWCCTMRGGAGLAQALLWRERRLSVADFRDRMAGAWLGQSVGVAYGWPTEFKANGTLVPEDKMPVWKPELVNETFSQDDLYVEMSFLRTLETRGIDVSSRLAGLDFANSQYRLWCANHNARNNLRNGIAAPDSGHPKFHRTTDDIDFQIEADFIGILAPGLPQTAVDLGNVFGRIMNYGDGLYAGQFVAGLYCAAYFSSDRVANVEAALRCIPAGSRYAEMVRDMLAWYRADSDDWQGAWRKAVDKYQSPAYVGSVTFAPIDVKINGAMVLLGYLYGGGDPDRTMYISTRGGYDSDCNPSSACGVLFTSLGRRALPARFAEKLDTARKWEHTDYAWPDLLRVTEQLARQLVVRAGGRIETDAQGAEWFVLPQRPVRPNALETAAAPGPAADVRYTPEEMAQIRFKPCAKEGIASEAR